MLKCLFTAAAGIFLLSCTVQAQESAAQKSKEEEAAFKPYHRFSIMMANDHIPGIVEESGAKKRFIVPAWGFDYDYWFKPKWAVGVHTDLVIQQYKIKKAEDGTELERSYPFGVSLVGLFKATEHLVFIGGIGHEFEKNEGLTMLDIGIEYGWELPKNWELSLNLLYENKFNAYDSYMFGIAISKKTFKR